MPQSQSIVTEYADSLLETPRAHRRLALRPVAGGRSLLREARPLAGRGAGLGRGRREDEGGLSRLREERLRAGCRLTREGMIAGGFLAQARGVKVPSLGVSVNARVSTGVLFRALGICQLDFTEEASYVLLERLLEEAEMQRGAKSQAE